MFKLVAHEDEAGALASYLDDLSPGTDVISSVLLKTEMHRVALTRGIRHAEVNDVLGKVVLISAPDEVFGSAAALPLRHLRSLDALHLATALACRADVLVGYDRRLLEVARQFGVSVASPR